MPTEHLKVSKLSLQAKGLASLVYALDKEEDYDFTAEELAGLSSNSVAETQAALDELSAFFNGKE